MRLLEPWRTRLLWASLAGNVFAAAAFAAPAVLGRRSEASPGFDRIIGRLARNLGASDAAGFREAMARERPWYEMSRDRLDDARKQVAQDIGREPFDPAAARAALVAMQDSMRESAARFDDSLVTALATLSPDARAAMAASLNRGRH